MKKIKFIAMAMLALLTAQCKKNEPEPEPKVMVPISGSVSFGGGSKTEITTNGYVTPKSGDMIYIYNNDGTNESTCVGSLECTAPSTGQAFTCSGTIDVNYLGKTCTFMYLGSENGTNGNSKSISFGDQTDIRVSSGKISGIDKFHVGSCKANVSNEGTVSLPMRTKISIAYFQLKDQNGSAMADNNITISGVSATATINKTDGTISGDGTGTIRVHTDANGCFYMALVPQSGAANFTFTSANANGTGVFPYGIGECCFYSEQGNVSKPLPVQMNSIVTPDLLPGKFSISATEYVQFSRGNLQATYNGSGYDWAFAANQYDYIGNNPGNTKIKDDGGNNDGAVVDLFGWSTEKTYYGISNSAFDGTVYSGDFRDWATAINSGTWCTLSADEWDYLINKRTIQGYTGLTNTCVYATVNGVGGLIIFCDDYDGPIGVGTTLTEIPEDCLFLPGAGTRTRISVDMLGNGYYWSSTDTGSDAKGLFFGSGFAGIQNSSGLYFGRSVRLVQRFPKPEIEPTFVDLGLPSGTLWADVNVGATAKTGVGSYGKFYAWGETESKSSFTLDNYKFTSSFNGYNSTDGLTELQPADDVAAMKVSGSHIPTRQQYEELINSTYTTCTWTDNYNSTGVPGLVITSNSNHNSIFLPAAGLQNGPTPSLVETNGCYWSSTLNPTPDPGSGTAFPACAIDLDFDKNTTPNVYKDNDDSRRFMGQAIRAVKPRPVPAGFVDLGLSVFWAESNLDGYYQFGATSQATGNGWSTTPFYVSGAGEDEDWEFSKYNTVGETLDASDDAAAVAGKGRIPSVAEWEELRTQCTWTWNGSGFTVSRNGKSITLPAGGQYGYGQVGEIGYYWSNHAGGNYIYDAKFLYFGTNEKPTTVVNKWANRKEGYSIRPVHD